MTDDDATVEAMARAIAPSAWKDDLPLPTQADTIAFHSRRQASITMARAALAVVREREGWRSDMENAPKDETDVLVWCANTGEQFVAYWCYAHSGWVYAHCHRTAIICKADRWRPLPAPPEGE